MSKVYVIINERSNGYDNEKEKFNVFIYSSFTGAEKKVISIYNKIIEANKNYCSGEYGSEVIIPSDDDYWDEEVHYRLYLDNEEIENDRYIIRGYELME